jgi:L-ascorbate metabolism protein UlaG (beta-lactamase superfamily)
MEPDEISREKNVFAIGLVGGPTVVIDYGGLRLITDPTFDPPGPAGPMTKLEAPAVEPADLGPADAVLLSHDQHADNLDRAGRVRGRRGPDPGRAGHRRPHGASAVGLETWQVTELARPGGGAVQVRALPAVHGPLDGARDAKGNVNCEVTGFLLTGDGLPSVYVSGDNASIEAVAQIAGRYPGTDIAILFAGAARVAPKERGRPLTLTAPRAADAAVLLGARRVLPAHCRGWSHYSEGPADLSSAFDEAGIASRLHLPEPGTWALRDVAA